MLVHKKVFCWSFWTKRIHTKISHSIRYTSKRNSIDIVFLLRRISKLHVLKRLREIAKILSSEWYLSVSDFLRDGQILFWRQNLCLTNRTIVINFNSLHLAEDILSLNIIHCYRNSLGTRVKRWNHFQSIWQRNCWIFNMMIEN